MLVLSVDTSTPHVTAGVCRLEPAGPGDGPRIETLATRVTDDARAHAELLTPHILECLSTVGITPTELDAVVVGVGPGPFTGLRVGMATAAAFADAIGAPVHGVCSLDAVAARARAAGVDGDVVVVTDARRREAYHARYNGEGVRTSGPIVGPAAEIDVTGARVVGEPAKIAEIPAVGDGTGAAGAGALTSPDPAGLVAVAAADLLAGTDPAPLVPLYLRRPDAVPPKPVEPSAALTGVQR
ncbi:tRNA (adenosine(37)-N6)-threonylcarbamoyltransferase complex dimerization subunit type 1 TsaB [Dietzia sp. NCCP-2495]|uniref:tRNA (adenosine(37)-N6)-threonylcarbamoyltransferase complex dimerization subunit type 1 TsaB n=1 Tax=Dietzia sp. NCCP-2495 TaxID=2934675 RepID=UPI00223069D9|nr:tRNA (adenosine(37)-N6)-threonylcarbamoyltransferase complex dimerization subunit type 1 TsaB [Dietzia sp. NCCP-2495]GLB65005.1 tRNA (adenosine(37)-N6)-threonylcarbamoyltransferase complex dimerization subunit type 1 TsaB [Dietzia sp. NCCP-2495]